MHLLCFLGALAALARADLQTVHEWRYLDFLWESEEHRLAATRSGEYNFSRVLPSDLAVAKGTGFLGIFLVVVYQMTEFSGGLSV